MRRIRWFAADWQVPIRTLATRMRAHPFRKESVDGFLLDKVRDNTISGRYIEKVSFQEKITDPFGGEQLIDRTLYRQLEFNLSKTFPNIEFWDAPRSTNGYISKLLEFSDFDITIAPLSVDVIEWADAFQLALKSKVTVVSLQISGLEIETGITAKVAVTGDKDVRESIKLVTKNKRYELDKLQLRVFRDNTAFSVHLFNAGAAKADEAFFEDLLLPLRSSLPRAPR